MDYQQSFEVTFHGNEKKLFTTNNPCTNTCDIKVLDDVKNNNSVVPFVKTNDIEKNIVKNNSGCNDVFKFSNVDNLSISINNQKYIDTSVVFKSKQLLNSVENIGSGNNFQNGYKCTVSREDCILHSLIFSSVDRFVSEMSGKFCVKQNEIYNSFNYLNENLDYSNYAQDENSAQVKDFLFTLDDNINSVENSKNKDVFSFTANHTPIKKKSSKRKKTLSAKRLKNFKKKNNLKKENNLFQQPARTILCASKPQKTDAIKVNQKLSVNNKDYIQEIITNDDYNKEYFLSKKWCTNSANLIESVDNNDPKWNDMKNINSDYDKFNFVRKKWHCLNIPNPFKNLTLYNGYSFNSSPSNVQNGILNNTSSMNASQYFDHMIKSTVTLGKQQFENTLKKNKNEYLDLQNKHRLQKNHKLSILKMNNLQLNQNEEINRLFTKHKERIDCIWNSLTTRLEKLNEASHEVNKYYVFYEDKVLHYYPYMLFQKIENTLEEYKNFYNVTHI